MRILCFDIGTKTLSLCAINSTPVEGGDPGVQILHWETINIHAENGVDSKCKPTMKQDSEYLMASLQRRVEMLMGHQLTNIIIEQQPAGGANKFSSTRMKVLSHTVHAFFHMFQLSGSGEVSIPVEFVSPSSKLKGMEYNESTEDKALRQAGDRRTMGAKYRQNKKHAVDVTTRLLAGMDDSEETHQARLAFARATPKQDDLSDAFLMAYAFGVKKSTVKKRKRG
jgi:hypothetical protein